jgi:pimeloyl-ACP methyl ester carboxylesterase/DNA-binding CsgD family transcriptional regulator
MKQQRIQFTRTADGVRLGWARAGAGPVLVRPATWLTHLQYDWESPVWRHWMEFLAGHFSFIRFDERGCGLSDRQVGDVSAGNWLPDLECVIDAAGIDKPMALLGISQGSIPAIQFAIRHPERVSKLILYGGYVRGWGQRGGRDEQHYHAVLEMIRVGWGSRNPVFRQAFTARFIPEGTHEQLDWFNELCRKSVDPEMAVRLLESRAEVNVSDLLGNVRVPTLVLHARHDEVVPFSEGRALATGIPDAEFVALDSSNHVLLAGEPAWQAFKSVLLEFAGIAPAPGAADLSALTRRERQILALLARAMTNDEIGQQLFISEKTVRNHLSSVYRKLKVNNRAQAMLKAGQSARSD